MTPIAKRLAAWRQGAQVRRYHTLHTLVPDYVGHHSGGVAWLCALAYGGGVRAELLMAALAHDLPECRTGDLPSPTKKALGTALDSMEDLFYTDYALPNYLLMLSDIEKRILNYCDAADGLLYCIDEMKRGNLAVKPIVHKYHEYLVSYFNSRTQSNPSWEELHGALMTCYIEAITQ